MLQQKVKFKHGTTSDFYLDVQRQVNEYFGRRKTSVYANGPMIFKTVLFLALYVGAYLLILSNRFGVGAMLLLVGVMGLSYPSIFLNIAHDASHNAFLPSRRGNRMLLSMLELIGMNAYIFDCLHNRVHHVFTSIEGEDIVVEELSVLRLSANQPYQKMHKYQVYYAPFIYCLFGIALILSLDFQLFKRSRMGNASPVQHPRWEYVKLYAFKLFYFFYTLVVPMLVLDLRWWQVLIGFLLMQFIGGLIFSAVGVLNHQIDESVFPEPDREGYIHNSKKNHELLVTIDFAPEGLLAGLLFGGFNTHVAHHLFPHICHCHYVAITRIIRETAPRYGLTYRQLSFRQAVRSHFRYLHRLSKEPASALA